MLSNLVNEIDSHNERVDIVASRVFSQVKDGRFISLGGYEKYKSCRGYEFLELMITDKIFHSVFPKLYRREFVINSGFFDYPVTAKAEDFMMNCFIALHKPFVAFSQTVNYYYRYNLQGATKKGGEICFDMLKSLNYIDEALQSCMPMPEEYKDMMQCQWLLHMESILYAHNISIRVKIKAMNIAREKLQGFRDNKYCFELWRKKTRFTQKLLFTGYEKHSDLMYILDPLLRFL